MMRLSSEPVGKLLTELHTVVRAALTIPRRTNDPPRRRNPKGDVSQSFDLIAEQCAHEYLRHEAPHGVLLSEESGALELGPAPPEFRFVLDPVDGSDNYARGIGPSAVCLAVLPVAAPLTVGNVEWSLVGELESATPLLARRGRGAYRGETPRCSSSTVSSSVGCSQEATLSPATLTCLRQRCGNCRRRLA